MGINTLNDKYMNMLISTNLPHPPSPRFLLWFCAQDPSAMPRPTSQDLAGFWDLLQLSIDDVTAKFDELQQIKSNQWHPVGSPEKKVKQLNCVHRQPLSPVP